jgi:hypothetical protein
MASILDRATHKDSRNIKFVFFLSLYNFLQILEVQTNLCNI